MAGELDVLTVRLDADIAAFQAQLDRARAQLTTFTSNAAPAAAATEKIGTVATRSIPGLGRLGNSLENVATRALGLPPVLGNVADVLGSFALGSGIMIGVFAGIAGLAALVDKLTESWQEARKAAKEYREEAEKFATKESPEAVRFQAALQAIKDLEKAEGKLAQRRLMRVVDPETGAVLGQGVGVAAAEKEVNRLRNIVQRNLRGIGDIAAESFERVAEEAKKSANQTAAEWKRTYAEIVAEARHFVELHPDPGQIGIQPRSATDRYTGGFFIPEMKPLKASSDALAKTFDKVGKAAEGFLPRGAGAVGGGGFVGGVWGNIKGMLDPTMIASNIAGGFITSGINLVVNHIAKVGSGLLGLGNAAEEAARRVSIAITSMRDSITNLTGTDLEKAIAAARRDVLQGLEAAGITIGGETAAALGKVRSFEELLAVLESLKNTPFAHEAFAAAIDLVKAHMEAFGRTVANVTNQLHNIPTGFKTALAQFNATTPSAAVAGAVGQSMHIRVQFEPEGILRTVEGQAVRKIRSGGRLEWELA